MGVPQIILICCEGENTEKLYFEIIQRVFRVTNISIKTITRAGQHYSLIDECVKKRQELVSNEGFAEGDIEVWAVCDRDDFSDSFTKLQSYADESGVKLAFSDPQFENYILQHFGSPNSSKNRGGNVEKELAGILLSERLGTSYNKSDLTWLENMIDMRPRTVNEAIKHADTYSNHTKQPFFTIQRLIKRIVSFRAK